MQAILLVRIAPYATSSPVEDLKVSKSNITNFMIKWSHTWKNKNVNNLDIGSIGII